MADNSNDLILNILKEKTLLKMEVGERTVTAFNQLKRTLSNIQDELRTLIRKDISKNIPVGFLDKGDYEAEFTIADDTIVFLMHTNVFTFENSHEIWKSSYVQQDHSRSFCGKIYVYNFLSDSFKYNRANDIGYLIARIFINKENHFFVEGKRQLGFLYNDFANAECDSENIRKVVESTILYSLDFDPYTPPYEQMTQLSVQEILDTTMQSKIATGKRLGFRFQVDNGDAL
ncbi:MAG: hypothetical protein NT126_07325 [Bacteroidetes bacterium]|nr:hypothetical protein [Bacteroidota bacterium]